MEVLERVAYLRGLYQGLEIDTGKKEGKLLEGMLEAMEDMARSMVALKEQNDTIVNQMDYMYDKLSSVFEDFEEGRDVLLDCEDLYQIICPNCGEVTYLDEGMLKEGSVTCAACGEELELDLSDLEEK